MFEKTTAGEWAVLGLSIISATMISLSRSFDGSSFGLLFLSYFGLAIFLYIVLSIIYWGIIRVYSKSQNWGIILWAFALVGIPLIIIFVLAVVVAFIFGIAGNGSSYQWEKYSNYGVAFNHPSSIPINTTAKGYSNATYYTGALTFDNPDHQVIIISWFPKGNAPLLQSIHNVFSGVSSAAQKDIPDLNMSSIQVRTHSGDTIYYVTGDGHDITLDGKMAYFIFAMWEDPPSQRNFMIITASYTSQEDAQSLFDGVLSSIESH